MNRQFFLLLAAILFVSCQHKQPNTQVTKYHDDGRAKPVVTLVPVLDSSNSEIPWNISEEFSANIKHRIANQGNIYLYEQKAQLSSEKNPFGSNNLSWVRPSFRPSEFVVFLELIEHESIPIANTIKDPSKISETRKDAVNLNISMRIRIMDIREETPKIVLQELIKDSYYLANNIIDRVDYNFTQWGSEEYNITPMGIAHSQFAKHVIERINDYIMLSKSL